MREQLQIIVRGRDLARDPAGDGHQPLDDRSQRPALQRLAHPLLEPRHLIFFRPQRRAPQAEAGATAELVYHILEILGWKITPEIALCLHAGIVTDTGRFQYQAVTPALRSSSPSGPTSICCRRCASGFPSMPRRGGRWPTTA